MEANSQQPTALVNGQAIRMEVFVIVFVIVIVIVNSQRSTVNGLQSPSGRLISPPNLGGVPCKGEVVFFFVFVFVIVIVNVIVQPWLSCTHTLFINA